MKGWTAPKSSMPEHLSLKESWAPIKQEKSMDLMKETHNLQEVIATGSDPQNNSTSDGGHTTGVLPDCGWDRF